MQNNPNNQSNLVKLSLDTEDFKGREMMNHPVQNNVGDMNNRIIGQKIWEEIMKLILWLKLLLN